MQKKENAKYAEEIREFKEVIAKNKGEEEQIDLNAKDGDRPMTSNMPPIG